MSMADVTVEIAFGSDPTVAVADTTWTDVTGWVAELPGGAAELVRTQRGKQYELDEFQAGVCQVVLDNRDGRFSPDNESSPYWPDVKPMRRIRVRATNPVGGWEASWPDVWWGGGDQTVFSGFVDQWPQQWLSHAAAQVTVSASDGFKVLHNVGLPTSVYALEVSDDGPEHWWRLGESSGTTAADSGTADRLYDGTYVGSPTLGASGLIEHESDTAVEFDGVNDRITTASSPVPSGDMTVEFVVKPAALPAAGERAQIVAGPDPLNVDDNNNLLTGSDAIQVTVTDAGQLKAFWRSATSTSNQQSASGVLAAGRTTHVAVVVGSATITIYVDGSASSGSGSVTSDDVDDGRDGFVVAGADDSDSTVVDFNGTVDEIAIYSSALTSTRVVAHASAVDAPWNGDTSGQRVGRALDIADWPAADRDLDAGETTFQDGSFADDDTVLAFVQRAARSEYGPFYIGPDSTAQFIGRHNLLTEDRYATSQATFSDLPTGSQLPYTDLQLDPSSDATVVNDWTVQRKFGPAQNVQNSTSISTYFERSGSRTALMMDTDTEARAQAEWLLAHTKDPVTRIRKMTLEPAMDDDLWAQVLGRRLMDRVTVNYRIPGGGTVSKEVHIIGVEHRIGQGRWLTDWWLSPADTQSYLILDDATFGTLGANRLGY